MKRRALNITIEKPCQQDWDKMTNVENGKFCSQCCKTVVDMTKLSDSDISNLIQSSSKSVCGKLLKSQLNHQYYVTPRPNKASIPIRQLLSGLFILTLLKSTSANPTSNKKSNTYTNSTKFSKTDLLQTKTQNSENDSSKKVIVGKVIDSKSNERIPFVHLCIVGSNICSATDSVGNFKIEVPKEVLLNEFTLKFELVGYPNHSVTFSPDMLPSTKIIHQNIIMHHEEIILGGIIGVEQKKWWEFWKRKHHIH